MHKYERDNPRWRGGGEGGNVQLYFQFGMTLLLCWKFKTQRHLFTETRDRVRVLLGFSPNLELDQAN